MTRFADTVAQVYKNLVAGPIGAQDMNAGDQFVDKPDEKYGRAESHPAQPNALWGRGERDLYAEDEELDKSVVPQHYISQYGQVAVLFKSGPPAMVIKANDELREDVTDREIVVGGYASPQVIDREKHLIQREAMEADLPRFLAVPQYRNAMILHSNVQVGEVLPEWAHPDTGKVYKTAVDDIGLFCVIKIRTDRFRPKIVDKVIEDIEKGNLKAFSISGDAPLDSRQHKCADGECFWVIPSIEFYEITICEEGVNQGAKLMILTKALECPDGKCGLVLQESPTATPAELPVPDKTPVTAPPTPGGQPNAGAQTGSLGGDEKATSHGDIGKAAPGADRDAVSPIPEGVDTDQPKPTPQAALPTGILDMDAEETEEALSERVGEIADVVGEEEAVDLVEDVAEAREKMEKLGTGLGSGGSGDANTMADFGKPYSRDTAIQKDDPSIDQFFQVYRAFLERGASPEDAYFKLLEEGADGVPAPDWFGTRDGKFRQFLLQAHHAGLAIPTIRLRMQGNKEGEIVPDPELMAWDLLQTAINRMRGVVDKDVSPVPHADDDDHAKNDTEPRLRQVETPREEAEQSERYYLNLALKSLNKGSVTFGHYDEVTDVVDFPYTPEGEEAIEDAKKVVGQLASQARKDCKNEFHLHPPDFEGPACKDGQGGLDKHKMRDDETHRHKRGVKGAAGVVSKHEDSMGSTAHHKRGGTGGIAAPPPGSVPQDPMQMEDRLKTLTAEVKERNLKGASLRLVPGYRNAPYAVTGLDALQRPVRLSGNVADITQALRENSAEVDELMGEEEQMNIYAVPVEVGKVNELKIMEGDGVSPLEYVRDQVAAASFSAAVATVLKQPKRGWQARDYRIDDRQTWEPENVSVQAGTRYPGSRQNENMEGHATTQIESHSDIERISGARSTGTGLPIATEPVEQVPQTHGIAQQGAVEPQHGIQGEGQPPEFIQTHEDIAGGMYEENQGTGLDPRADHDRRGAPVTPRTRRP